MKVLNAVHASSICSASSAVSRKDAMLSTKTSSISASRVGKRR
jgi:hypothetical protein